MHNSKSFRVIDDSSLIIGEVCAATKVEALALAKRRFPDTELRVQGPNKEPSLADLGLRRAR